MVVWSMINEPNLCAKDALLTCVPFTLVSEYQRASVPDPWNKHVPVYKAVKLQR